MDRHVWAKGLDPDQSGPLLQGAVWSGSTLFTILSAFFGHILYGKSILVKFEDNYMFFGYPNF